MIKIFIVKEKPVGENRLLEIRKRGYHYLIKQAEKMQCMEDIN